jgi:hypothetical protein
VGGEKGRGRSGKSSEDDTRAWWGICTSREWRDGQGEERDNPGCGSENTSGVDPIDQGSAVVDPSAGLQAE